MGTTFRGITCVIKKLRWLDEFKISKKKSFVSGLPLDQISLSPLLRVVTRRKMFINYYFKFNTYITE